jgi:hypothetical protein
MAKVQTVKLPSIRSAGQSCAVAALCALLLGACSTASRPAAHPVALPGSSFDQELTDACGQPVAYPISPKCVSMMGSVGPLLQHRSDLIMKIWRSCPDENPCYRITRTDPACNGAPAAQPVSLGNSNQSCKEAQETDHSCAALLRDPVYANLHQAAFAPEPYDCQRAKNDLAELDREVDRMSLRIQWYRVFAAQGF